MLIFLSLLLLIVPLQLVHSSQPPALIANIYATSSCSGLLYTTASVNPQCQTTADGPASAYCSAESTPQVEICTYDNCTDCQAPFAPTGCLPIGSISTSLSCSTTLPTIPSSLHITIYVGTPCGNAQQYEDIWFYGSAGCAPNAIPPTADTTSNLYTCNSGGTITFTPCIDPSCATCISNQTSTFPAGCYPYADTGLYYNYQCTPPSTNTTTGTTGTTGATSSTAAATSSTAASATATSSTSGSATTSNPSSSSTSTTSASGSSLVTYSLVLWMGMILLSLFC
jgi:hypothetical protein